MSHEDKSGFSEDPLAYAHLVDDFEPPASAGGWHNWLLNVFPNFDGNSENAAHLLQAFDEGAEWMLEVARQGSRPIEKFRFGITDDGHSNTPRAITRDGDLVYVLVSLRKLAQDSRLDPDGMEQWEWKHSKRNKPEFVHHGSIRDYYKLYGVHESYHAAAMQEHPDITRDHDREPATSMVALDGQTEEFIALGYELQFSKENHLPLETSGVLQSRFDNARAYMEVQHPQAESINFFQKLVLRLVGR